MYDDLLGPRKEKKKLKTPYDSGCDQENKPAQPEKFDSHTKQDNGNPPDKDHWADVDSDVDEKDLEEIEDLILEEFEDEDELEVCDGGDACDGCDDDDCDANTTDPA